MTRSAAAIGLAFLLTGFSSHAAAAQEAAREDAPHAGTWVAERIVPDDGDPIEEPQPLMLLLTGSHYGILGSASATPRQPFSGEEPSEAEKVAAYDGFFASAGSYAIEGDSLVYRARVALDPGYAAGYPDNPRARRIRVDGDTLYWHAAWGVLTFRRLE